MCEVQQWSIGFIFKRKIYIERLFIHKLVTGSCNEEAVRIDQSTACRSHTNYIFQSAKMSSAADRKELDARARSGETVVEGGTGGKSLEAQEHLAEGTKITCTWKCATTKTTTTTRCRNFFFFLVSWQSCEIFFCIKTCEVVCAYGSGNLAHRNLWSMHVGNAAFWCRSQSRRASTSWAVGKWRIPGNGEERRTSHHRHVGRRSCCWERDQAGWIQVHQKLTSQNLQLQQQL